MHKTLIKNLISEGQITPGMAIKDKAISSYTYYSTVKELESLGIASTKDSKTVLSDSLVTAVFKKLFFEGFDIELLSKKNVKLLLLLLEPKTLNELSEEYGLSAAQANKRVSKFSQFLGKEGNKYALSKSNPLLFEFISLIQKKSNEEYFWSKGEEKLLKLPLDFEFDGTLTGFSRFSEFGLQINPSHNFVYVPKKELLLEEILSHAIKFSANANDLVLCILFYLKNKPKINVIEIEKNCEKLGVLQLWFDIVSYLEEQPVREEKMFLPGKEFLAKAAVYDIQTKKRYGQQTLDSIFHKAEEKLLEKVRIFLIGGNALIEYKAKNSTKDMDLVLLTQKEAASFIKALEETGYSEIKGKELQYGQLEASAMLENADSPRIDLFVRVVCNALEYSERMQKRSKKISDGKLEIYLTSLEDIFLLKSVSARDSDLVDCENILSKTTLNWKIIYDEIILQDKNLSGMKEMIILDHLEALEKRLSIKIPVTKKVLSLCLEKSILYLAKKPISANGITRKIGFPKTTIRNKIAGLVKKKKLKKIKEKPFKVVIVNN
ncbi:MAG: DUF6036 family nucleotidyltransferase [Candidatus Diapherotrites archaeon]